MNIANVLLIVDTKNLFNTLHKTYNNGKLDYQRYYELAVGNDHCYHSIAYGQQSENNSVNFITVLTKLGFITKFKQLVKTAGKTYYTNSNVQMAIDVTHLTSSNKIDRVVIGSSDPELVDLVNFVRASGYRCDVIACRIPKVLKDVTSSYTELDATHLLDLV